MANTIWNVADKSSNVTLSGSNLIATAGSAAQGGVRAVDRQVTGKVYWECTLNTITGAGTGVGVSLAGFTITQNPSSTGVAGSCALVRSGLVHMGSGDVAGVAFGVIPNGTVVCIAYDIGAGTIWFRLGAAGLWNTNAAANPATGAGGILTPGLGGIWPIFPTTWFAGTSDQTTANFGNTAFVGAVPAGFAAGFVAGAAVPTNLGAWGLVRETVSTTTGELRVQGLAREVIGASGAGLNWLIVQGLIREVVGFAASSIPVSISEPLTALDTVSAAFGASSALAEPLTALDTVSAAFGASSALAEPLAALDTVSATFGVSSALAEPAAAADTLSATFGASAALAEPAAATDALSASFVTTWHVALGEAAPALDTLSARFNLNAVFKLGGAALAGTAQPAVFKLDGAVTVDTAQSAVFKLAGAALVETTRFGVFKIAGAALYEPDAINRVTKIAGAVVRELGDVPEIGAVTSVIKVSGAIIYESIVPVIEYPPGTFPSSVCGAPMQPPARPGCEPAARFPYECARTAWGGKPPVRLYDGSTARPMAGAVARPGREPVARAGRC